MTSQTPANLARKLEHIRKIELCYSVAEMAEALGPEVSERDVREFERGEQIPSLLTVLRYARLVGTSTDILIDDEREIRPNTGKW